MVGISSTDQGTAPFLISPMEGLMNLGLVLSYASGCDGVACTSTAGFSDIIKLVKANSFGAIIAVIGLDQTQER